MTEWKARCRLIHSVEKKLFDFQRGTPRAFWASFALNLACQGMAILEVFLVLWLLGLRVAPLEAFVFEALTKLVNAVGTLTQATLELMRAETCSSQRCSA